ncbi:hypothetical protein NL676_009667 [Syzygium grande]|nr:hypothetical protein NL676_009667 [Syzygium grande]
MGGKGRRRREKNYRGAHGGRTALPPPPDPSQVDALPSKLRRLISFASSPPPPPQGAAKDSNAGKTCKRSESGDDEKHSRKGGLDSKAIASEVGGGDERLTTPWNDNDEISRKSAGTKRKRKGKKGQPEDLRFQAPEESSTSSRRKERKKMYRE